MINPKKQLFAATFLMEICYGLFILLASIKAAEAIKSPFILGLTGILHVTTRIMFTVLFGRLSDRVGRKYLLLFSCVCFAAAYLILNCNGVFFIFLAFFVYGIGNSIFWPLIGAWVGQGSSNRELIFLLGFYGLAISGGIATGNVTGGFFRSSAQLSFYFAFGLLLIISWLIYRTPDNMEAVKIGTTEITGDESVPGLNLQTRNDYMYIGWLANFASWTAIGVLRFLFPQLCLQLGISKMMIGNINAVFYGAWFCALLIMIRHRAWLYKINPLVILQAVGVIALTLIAFRQTLIIFFIGFGLFGISVAMTYFSSVYYSQNGSLDRGNKNGLHETFACCGQLVGPFIGGAAAEFFTMGAPFLVSAFIIVVVIVLEYRIIFKAARNNPSPTFISS